MIPVFRHIFLQALFCCVCFAADWSIEIVPSSVTQTERIIEADHNDPHFYVILTNKSERDLTVWREWCSWGYYNLSFTITQPDGSSFTLERMGGAWLWNNADSTIVRRGKSFVIEATIDKHSSGSFEGFPKTFKDGEVTIQAHYSVKEDKEAKKKGAWTGKVSSEPEKVTIRKSLYD